MTSGKVNVVVRKAQQADLDDIKTIADAHKTELGFVRRPTLQKSIETNEVLAVVTTESEKIVGFVHYHHRKDARTTLYNIVVIAPYRRNGIATRLIAELEKEARSMQSSCIVLKCPVELSANRFYERYGFSVANTENGKHRPLNIWRFTL